MTIGASDSAVDDTGPAMPVRQKSSNVWWIVLVTGAMVATGMAFSLWWAPLVRHGSDYWIYPVDLFFGTLRASRLIGDGALSYIYSLHGGIETLPGIAILLLPVVKLSDALHLIPTTPGFPVPRPSQFLLIGPLSIASSAVALAGLDGLARTLGTPLRRRRILLLAEATALWPVVVLWGHPEDVIALGLGAMAFGKAIEGRTVSAGWLLGGALAMQLYIVALVPIIIGLLGLRRSASLLARAAVLPGAILLAMVIPNTRATIHGLLEQPNATGVNNHPTPWVLIVPHIGHGLIAAGPGRMLGLAGACALGYLALRFRDDPPKIVWLAGAALALRCLTEPVIDPYYVAPAIAMVLVMVARHSWRRWGLVVASGSALTVFTYHHVGMWWYWGGIFLALATMLVVTWGERSTSPTPAPGTAPSARAWHTVDPLVTSESHPRDSAAPSLSPAARPQPRADAQQAPVAVLEGTAEHARSDREYLPPPADRVGER